MNKLPSDVKLISNLMDKKFQGPFSIRFGLDGIIGLIPFWGDLSTLVISHYVIIRAVSLKCPPSILVHMLLNSYLDFLIGSIPFVGDLFDFYWKANSKNARLLSKYLEKPGKTKVMSGLSLLGVMTVTLGLLIGSIFLIIYLFNMIRT